MEIDKAKRRSRPGGMRYIIIRYGTQYQVLFPLDNGHLSVGVKLKADVEDTAEAILKFIK